MVSILNIGCKGDGAGLAQTPVGLQRIATAICAESLRQIDLVTVAGVDVILDALKRGLVRLTALLGAKGCAQSKARGFSRRGAE